MESDPYREAMADVMATPQSVLGFALVALIMILSMLSAVGAVVSFLFTMTLFRIPEEHRRMGLGKVWLILVPFFGVYWMYVTIRRLAESFRSYFAALEADDKAVPKVAYGSLGVPAGIVMCILAVVAHLAGLLVYTKSPMVIGIGLGSCVLLGGVAGVIYFAQIYKVRSHIPDPGQETVPESYL